MSFKVIDRNIRAIVTAGAKFNTLIHQTALLVIGHSAEHGDCSRVIPLLNAMPASMRRTMLKLWFETYSPIRVQMTDGVATKVEIMKAANKRFTPYDLDLAAANPFFSLAEANPEKGPMTFDAMLKMVQAIVKRAEKAVDDGKAEVTDIPSIKAAARLLAGLKIERAPSEGEVVEAAGNDALIAHYLDAAG